MTKKILVIGGGASGFFSALNIAEKHPNYEVVILGKSNKLLSKLRVSGGGRCNVTHACFVSKELVDNYPRGNKELLGPFHHFSTGDVIEWFANRDVELKIEEDGRIFPVSDSSETIIQCFMNQANKFGVKLKLNSGVEKIEKKENFILTLSDGQSLESDSVVVAMGGNPKLKHYEFLHELGHQIEKPIPSLFTFNLPKHRSNQLMGLAVDACVKIIGTEFEEYGPVLFTHWGMSGPGILKLSSRAAIYLYNKSYQFDYEVEWVANGLEFIIESRKSHASKKISKIKPENIPARLWTYLLDRSGVRLDKNWADLSKVEIAQLQDCLERDLYHANGKTTFKEEFVTSGGVNLKDINMKTMESKNVPSLFFCGEVINVDAVTGGFNFQAAWTSGWLVSENI
jgi:predicted Rossmann fold flavoprotein